MDIHFHFHVMQQIQSNADMQNQPSSNATLWHTIEQRMKEAAMSKSTSTQANYLTATRSFRKYLKDDLPLSCITADTISGYERWLRKQGISLNTTSCYLRSLRSLLVSSDEKLVRAFEAVFTGSVKTDKRSVPLSTLVRLRELTLRPASFDELARDIFLFSFYAMGMPFVDVAHLQHKQITDGQIVYFRQKTGQRVTIALEPPMQSIINRHTERAAANYVFPLLQKGTDHEYQVVLGRYNRALVRLSKKAGIGCRLTSYVVRHSWASTAYSANVDLPVISKALGHTNPNTTLTYIREIDDLRLQEANHQIISMVEQG